jgi:tRNA (guanine37-N1)-methyltransferase
MRYDVLTLFPEIFSGFVGSSLLGQAIESNLVSVHLWNFREWTENKHQRVDDRPYGGGPGMVLSPQPILDCLDHVKAIDATPGRIVMLTPAGRRMDQRLVEELAAEKRLIFLCGRYEGFDDRIRQIADPLELSLGDYVLNGGEVAAMAVIEATMRLIPGVLGDEASAKQDSHSETGHLEYPQFTRPRVYRGYEVPEILVSGNHQAVAAWRADQSKRRSEGDRRTGPNP